MAPTTRAFDVELAAVHSAGALPPGEALVPLRKALGSRHNLVVSTAAKYAARLQLTSLSEDMAAAFARFLPAAGNPAKTDPQCWAKNELAKALAAFEYQDPEPFLAGVHHQQFEPVWGGSSDTAGALRGTCALALVLCRELSADSILRQLIPLFHDKEVPVRINAVRALTQLGTTPSALLLRLRVELGSEEPEVLGACFSGVLSIEGEPALPWLAGFLTEADETAAEAAFALAEHRSSAAFTLLQTSYDTSRQGELRRVLSRAMAAMRLEIANDFLLQRLAHGGPESRASAEALWEAEPSSPLQERLVAMGFPRPAI